MKKSPFVLAFATLLAVPSSATLDLKLTNPADSIFNLAPGQSAPLYGTIMGVDGDVSSFSFMNSTMGGPAIGATFAIANDGTANTLGGYIAQNTTADFSGLLGTITATGTSGLRYTDVLTVYDSSAGESDGENVQIRILAAPEPTSFSALGLGALAMLRRRRRPLI